jgi:TRAP-type uncharacterized transport system fused permease subunit
MDHSGSSFGGKKTFQPGGTPGGGWEFLVGLVMIAVGIYMVFNRVTVSTSPWRILGNTHVSFGLTLLPLLFGIAVLAFNGRSVLGWLLAAVGVALVLFGVLMNLDIYFQPTSLWTTVLMFGLIAFGLGLFARALRPHRDRGAAA